MIKRTLRRACVLMLALSLAMAFTVMVHAEDASSITDYHIRVSVQPDKSYKVTEEITAKFPSGTHIFEKKIPMSGMKIDEDSLKGDKTDVSLDMERDQYVIRAGSDAIAEKGEEVYKFTYNVRAYDGNDISNDEFNFILLPEGWNIAIENFKAHISMPKKFEENCLHVLSAEGDPISGGITKKVNNDAIDITGQGISAAAGLSCNIILPDSYWNGASTDANMKYYVIGLLALIPFLIMVFWFVCGRDPRRSKGEYHYPPEGMTPMEMGYIVDGMTDYRDAASMVIYFAQKGYLRIDEYEKGHVRLVKIKDIPMGMEKPFAVTLFDALFEDKNEITVEELDREFGRAYMDSRKELRHYYTGGRRLFTRTSRVMRTISIILACLPATGIIAASAIYKMEMKQMILALPALILVLGGCMIMTRAFDRKFVLSKGQRMKKYVIGAVMIAIAALGAGYYTSDIFGIDYGIGAVASTGISVMFIMMLKARTRHSSQWLDQILGLKSFIKSGEYNTCSILNGKRPGYYYEILPYAYALDLMPKWSKTFMKTDPGVPEWYRQFGVTKEEPVQLLEADTSEEEKKSLPEPEAKPMSLQEKLHAVKDRLMDVPEEAPEAEKVEVPEEELPAVIEEPKQEEPSAPVQQKKGFLGQIAQWGDRFKPHPELDFIRKFDFEDFAKTLKSEIDRLSDGIVKRMDN